MKLTVGMILSWSICLVSSAAHAQTAAHLPGIVNGLSSAEIWKILTNLDFKWDTNRYTPVSVLTQQIKALEGKRIVIKGFIIPLEDTREQKYFMLSLVPYSECF